MTTRSALVLLAAGIAAVTTFAIESGATPPGAPTPTGVNFAPDPLGAKPVPWSPAQLVELGYFSPVAVINVGANRAIQWGNSVDMRVARPTNEIQFSIGTSLATPMTATFYFGAAVVGTVSANGDGTININQTLRYRDDDLFDRVVISQAAAIMRMDNVVVAPRCTWVGTNAANVRTGTAGNDVLCGRGGNDKLAGVGGNDRIVAGTGNDKLLGGNNNDDLFGGPGTDILDGGINIDHCDGGPDVPDTAIACELVIGVP